MNYFPKPRLVWVGAQLTCAGLHFTGSHWLSLAQHDSPQARGQSKVKSTMNLDVHLLTKTKFTQSLGLAKNLSTQTKRSFDNKQLY